MPTSSEAPVTTSSTAVRSKYRNTKVAVDGATFDSRKEAARWVELRALESAGVVAALRRQVRIPIVVSGSKVCSYVADFVYIQAGRRVVEDVKSAFTRKLPVYRLKKKLIKAACGIEIQEI